MTKIPRKHIGVNGNRKPLTKEQKLAKKVRNIGHRHVAMQQIDELLNEGMWVNRDLIVKGVFGRFLPLIQKFNDTYDEQSSMEKVQETAAETYQELKHGQHGEMCVKLIGEIEGWRREFQGNGKGSKVHSYKAIVTQMSTVQGKSVIWLWWPYIAIGKICMVDGDPEVGKSLLTLQIAARGSVGDPFPDQRGKPTITYGGPFKTLILCREDGIEDTIKPRLDQAVADIEMIYHMNTYLDEAGGEQYFDFQHLEALEDALREYQPKLVIIDPIQSFVGKVNINQSNETRPLLDKLGGLAERYQCAIVLIRHPSKAGQNAGKVIHRGIASVDFIGAARTGIFFEQHPRNKNMVFLSQSKNNLGPKGVTQVFSKRHGQFRWYGVSRLSAEAIGGNVRGPDPHAFLTAACWLESHMTPRMKYSSDKLTEEAAKQGINYKMLVRAKQALGVKNTKGSDGKWSAELPRLPKGKPPQDVQGTEESPGKD
jgi:DNA repair protein RadA/Sms